MHPPPCPCREQCDVTIHTLPSPLSLRATQWRGNPAGHFGIPDYDPDWIAASALSGLPRDDTFSFSCHCRERSDLAIHASLPCPCREQCDVTIHPPPPLSLRATQWRGNPAENFGIPHYDTDWIATSALAGLPRDDTFSFYCPCGKQSDTAIHASLPCPCREQRDVTIHTLPSPLSLRATEWRGNPAENFGIPHYDTDWIATSALAGLPRDDTFLFYCHCGEQSGKASLAHASPPCHCEPRSGVAIQPDTLASRTTIQTGSPRRPLRAFLAMTLSLFYCPCGEQSGKASLAHASPPCHCEPRSGVAIQPTLWHPALRYRLDRRVGPSGLPRDDKADVEKPGI
jgi:rhodanese-related sulfurtransferase